MFYDMKLTSRGRSRAEGNIADFPTESKSLTDIKAMVDDLLNDGDTFLQKGQNANSNKYYIAHSETVLGYWVLLINRCDPSAPDSVYSDPESKQRMVNTKPPGHGSEYSAHLILNTKPVKDKNYYFCIIEAASGAGLGATAITSFFSHVIRHCKKQYPAKFKISNIDGSRDKKGNPKLVRHEHEVELQGHIADTFKSDLQAGALQGIELISYQTIGNKWDDAGFVKEKQRVIKLQLEKDLIGDAVKTVQAVFKNAKKDTSDKISQMRVSFKDHQGSPNSALLSVDTGNIAGEGRYLKKHYISSANNVSSESIVKVNDAIVKEIISSLER
ncbi:hypothetical protein V2K60_25460 [Pseudomonas alliivorans]|nr:hypothetical protein [Pseudomonas alliivorans]